MMPIKQTVWFRGEMAFVRDNMNSFLKDYPANAIYDIQFIGADDGDPERTVTTMVVYQDWSDKMA
jgi:hypothetical protein